jgi:translation initiation factor IF-2
MGHVDHGKTSLLDAIRETNVTAQEAGGITQHIGASQVEINGKSIIFLDTPGHEAFTAMRARGAKVTDIAVLVVAADDGVMPQTVEAINHAKAAGVPIIVAINKIDKPTANPERVKQQLAEYNLIPEEWGGDTVFVNVSAKTREGIDHLLEMILLVAEMSELKANYTAKARGVIIESKLDKGRGPVATVLIQRGTLKVGDPILAGTAYGKVRALFDSRGKKIKSAGPSIPVEVVGLSEVPNAGDILRVVSSEKEAKEVAENRKQLHRETELTTPQKISLNQLFEKMQKGEVKELNIIVKADVQGSIEALKQALEKCSTDQVQVKIIHCGVGAITESDIMLASASNAIIIGFNVRPDSNAKKLAEREHIDIRTYRIIYDVVDDIQAAMKGMLEPQYEEVVLGRAEVRALFKVPTVGVVAGCFVTEGKITRNAQIRVLRHGVVVHEGRIASLKRFKDDVREVVSGFECGIGLEKFNDIKERDVLEAFIIKPVER